MAMEMAPYGQHLEFKPCFDILEGNKLLEKEPVS
jgi:hypothetical protein